MGNSAQKTKATYYDPPRPITPFEMANYLADSANGFVYHNVKEENFTTGQKQSWRVTKDENGKLTVYGLDPYLQQEIILGEFQADPTSENYGLWDVDLDSDLDLVFEKEGTNYFALSNYNQIQKLSRVFFAKNDERLSQSHKRFAQNGLESLGVLESVDINALLAPNTTPTKNAEAETTNSPWAYRPPRPIDFVQALQSHPTFGSGVLLLQGVATLVSQSNLKESLTHNTIVDYISVYQALGDQKKAKKLAQQFGESQTSPAWSTKNLFEEALIEGGRSADNALFILREMNLEMWSEDPLPLIRALNQQIDNSYTRTAAAVEVLSRKELIRSPLAQEGIAKAIEKDPKYAFHATKPTGVFPFDLRRYPDAREKLFECALNTQNASRKPARQNCFAALASSSLDPSEEDQLTQSARRDPLPGYAVAPLIENARHVHYGPLLEAGLWSLRDYPEMGEPNYSEYLSRAMAARFYLSEELFLAIRELHGMSENPFTIFMQSLDCFPERSFLEHYPIGSRWYTYTSPTQLVSSQANP